MFDYTYYTDRFKVTLSFELPTLTVTEKPNQPRNQPYTVG